MAFAGEDFTEAEFCADHRDVVSGAMHGHTWHVQIFWPAEPFRDARVVRASLLNLLTSWNCKPLEECGVTPTTNYGVACAILDRMPELSGAKVRRGGLTPCGVGVRRA